MSDSVSDVLGGRVDALYLALGGLVAELEDAGVIDGVAYVEKLKRSAEARATANPGRPDIQASAGTLMEIARRIEEARRNRGR